MWLGAMFITIFENKCKWEIKIMRMAMSSCRTMSIRLELPIYSCWVLVNLPNELKRENECSPPASFPDLVCSQLDWDKLGGKLSSCHICLPQEISKLGDENEGQTWIRGCGVSEERKAFSMARIYSLRVIPLEGLEGVGRSRTEFRYCELISVQVISS